MTAVVIAAWHRPLASKGRLTEPLACEVLCPLPLWTLVRMTDAPGTARWVPSAQLKPHVADLARRQRIRQQVSGDKLEASA